MLLKRTQIFLHSLFTGILSIFQFTSCAAAHVPFALTVEIIDVLLQQTVLWIYWITWVCVTKKTLWTKEKMHKKHWKNRVDTIKLNFIPYQTLWPWVRRAHSGHESLLYMIAPKQMTQTVCALWCRSVHAPQCTPIVCTIVWISCLSSMDQTSCHHSNGLWMLRFSK